MDLRHATRLRLPLLASSLVAGVVVVAIVERSPRDTGLHVRGCTMSAGRHEEMGSTENLLVVELYREARQGDVRARDAFIVIVGNQCRGLDHEFRPEDSEIASLVENGPSTILGINCNNSTDGTVRYDFDGRSRRWVRWNAQLVVADAALEMMPALW